MRNPSLARIMYGTSQEYSVAAVASTSALPPVTNLSARNDSHPVREPETLAELLRKAWANLSGKH